MNYYIPYFHMNPSVVTPMIGKSTSNGLFSKLLGGLNWSAILNNTQKTLGIVNQAIPMVKQISPVVKNAKTMFKVMNEFKKTDVPVVNDSPKVNNLNTTTEPAITESNISSVTNYTGGPTFFVN